jgi:DNA polymerase-1
MNRVLAFDTETARMAGAGKAMFELAPALVCLSVSDGAVTTLHDPREAVDWFLDALGDGETTLVGHNVVFDLAVLVRAVFEDTDRDVTGDVFDALAAGRILDTKIRAQLLSIAYGTNEFEFSLGTLVKRHLKIDLSEEKKAPWAWRLRYHELLGVPLDQWPAAARQYALDDATHTWNLFRALPAAPNEKFQVCAAWWLHLAGCRGIEIDAEWAYDLDGFFAREQEAAAAKLRAAGILRPSGSQDKPATQAIFVAAFKALGLPPARTDKGAIACNADAMRELEEAADVGFELPAAMIDLVEYNRAGKFRSTYLEPILAAADSAAPLCASYNVLVESGRTSCRAPNLQNIPARAKPREKSKERHGSEIRGCFVPRPGYVFVQADYSSLELATLAQVLNYVSGRESSMARAINLDRDLHLSLAASILGISYEAALALKKAEDPKVLETRQTAKVANFGYPGGCGAATFASMARAQGVAVSVETAEQLRRAWFEAWPEVQDYFAWIGALKSGDGLYVCKQFGPSGLGSTWRVRRTPSFTAAANTFFQGLAADGAKYAGWLISREAYTDPSSPLYGGVPLLFVHDEFVVEVPEAQGAAALERLQTLMVSGMRLFTPDVKIKTEGKILAERWSK